MCFYNYIDVKLCFINLSDIVNDYLCKNWFYCISLLQYYDFCVSLMWNYCIYPWVYSISVNIVHFVIYLLNYVYSCILLLQQNFLLMGHVINLTFICLINYMLFDCNKVGRKLRWSLKEFDLTWPFQGSCPSANLKCPGELKPTQASFVAPLLFKYKRTRNQQIPSSSAYIC